MTPPTLEHLAQTLEEIRGQMASWTASEQVQQQAFDALYEELQSYKEDHALKFEKPLLLDLLLFYDSMSWFHQSLKRQELSAEAMTDAFQYLMDEFLELLYRRDVTPMDPQSRFDRQNHKPIKALPTDDPGQDQLIAQVVKRGFMRGEKQLRPESVVIYRHTPGQDPGEGSGA